tara:strand:+ start:164 stop:670 length:507 start_codon:yes stop_codon:yes gene_type:complete
MIKIIDNFLDLKEFEEIKGCMESSQFPWYFHKSSKVYEEDGKCQHTHMFFGISKKNYEDIKSDWLDMWNNFMIKVESTRCYRIKANMTLKLPSQKPDDQDWHIDLQGEALKTAIFYINTNDGYTEFKNGVKVESVANRVCIFDSTLQHRGVGHTSPDNHRIVVNFNYS